MSKIDFSKKRVLIVDDHAQMRFNLKAILDQLGVTKIDTVNNGEDAIEILRQKTFDIVLCDYELGRGKDGQQILEETRFAGLIKAGAAFIMITAAQTIEMVMGALEYHPDGYIAKPITFNELYKRLARILKNKARFEDINKLIDNKQYDKAIETCNKFIIDHPKFALSAYRIKGKLLLQENKLDEAVELYQTVIDLRKLAWAEQGLAKCYFLQKKYSAAEDILKTLIKKSDKFVECYDLLAKIYEEQSKLTEAQKVLVDAIERSPKAILRQTHLSHIATKNKSWEVAEKASRKAVYLSNNSCYQTPEIFLNLANALQIQLLNCSYRGKNRITNEIFSCLNNVRQQYPLDDQTHIRASLIEGATYKNLGQEAKAKETVKVARKIFETVKLQVEKPLIQDIGTALVETGQEQEATEMIANTGLSGDMKEEMSKSINEQIKEKEIQQAKLRIEHHNNVGVRLFEKGLVEESLKEFEKASNDPYAGFNILLNTIQAIVTLLKRIRPLDQELAERCQNYFKRLKHIKETDEGYERYKKLNEMFTDLLNTVK